ncbi:GWxTD domain-containing protein [Hymenobacter cavernae]|uniref:GWxTD domain-containing protein n=1 Tax=Hymenobacter cavernae TaxID=2044852 RepID=A0ABQ1TK18_9BACT|nr:GWxTD domain-containing protein [Hymenobacter cavernae]GGE96210.1 hypothetical protein GCM10011383_03690 [Hymenobacter cavernae]
MLSLLSLLSAVPAGPRRDFSDQYRTERQVQVDTRRENDSLHVFLRFADAQAPRSGQPLQVAAWPDYESRRPVWQDSVRHLSRRTRHLGSATLVDFSLPVASLAAGQLVNVYSGTTNNEDSGAGVWLEITPERLNRTFMLTDSVGDPLLRRYVRVGEVFQVSSYGAQQPLTIKQYEPNFMAALPPMTNPATLPPPPRTMTLQDSSTIQAGRRIKLAGPGLYSLRVNGSTRPVGLLAERNSFPELTVAVELIQPLIYLTSTAERQKLYNSPDPKRAVDQFWLGVAANQQVIARQLIRTYYERVAAANRLFSSYKAGWMTDRGMLYIVYGPPETVYRTATEERWLYRPGTTGEGTYTFHPKPSTFAPEHYELVRRPEYERLWYAAVEQWRKGLTAPTAR